MPSTPSHHQSQRAPTKPLIFGLSPRKALAALLILLGLFAAEEAYRWPNQAAFYALDVGQGDSLLLTTPESQVVLVDGGPGQAVLSQLGSVLPFLWRHIDWVVLTHPHADHIEGLIPVLERYQVDHILMSAPQYTGPAYQNFLSTAKSKNIPILFARADQDFDVGSLHLDVLYPFKPIVGQAEENINNVSVVIRATFKPPSSATARPKPTASSPWFSWPSRSPSSPWTLMLTGDAEKEVEAALVEAEDRGEINLSADVLKAGHHGSKTSSTPEFVERVSPQLMVISCGVDNDYGHPDPETLQTAAQFHIPIRRTDLEGRIALTPF